MPRSSLWAGCCCGVVYLDLSKAYVIPGPIIELNTGINKSVEKLTELEKSRRIDLSRIPLEDALIIGEKEAAVKIIVFTDPDCPFCGKFHTEIKKVAEKRKDIAFYIKLLPLKIHPDAYWKSKSILCNKSLKFLEDNFEKKPIPKPDPNCQTKEVDENINLAKEFGINGTPTTIFPDGLVHAGFIEADRLIEMVDLPRCCIKMRLNQLHTPIKRLFPPFCRRPRGPHGPEGGYLPKVTLGLIQGTTLI